jgi:hypothetical protein
MKSQSPTLKRKHVENEHNGWITNNSIRIGNVALIMKWHGVEIATNQFALLAI